MIWNRQARRLQELTALTEKGRALLDANAPREALVELEQDLRVRHLDVLSAASATEVADTESHVSRVMKDATAVTNSLEERIQALRDARAAETYRGADTLLSACPGCDGHTLFVDDSLELETNVGSRLPVRAVVCGNCGDVRFQANAESQTLQQWIENRGLRRVEVPPAPSSPFRDRR